VVVLAPPAEPVLKDNPVKGTIYFIIHGVISAVNFFVVKAAFDRNPDMSPWQMTLARASVSCLIMLIWLNINLKTALIDNVDRSTVPSLVFRCLQGAISVTITFTCLKYLPVSTVGIVNRMQPAIVVFIAFFVLSERLKSFDILTLILATAGAVLIVVGMQGEPRDAVEQNPWTLFALAINPVLLASG